MLEFKPVTLADKSLLEPILYQNPYLLCNWSFSNTILWHEAFLPHYTFINDMLVLALLKDKDRPVYNFPVGHGDPKPVIDTLITHAQKNNYLFKMVHLTDEMKAIVETIYPDQFEFEEKREAFDYIYHVQDLLHLTGKKYQAKRNHINKFKKTYPYTYASLTKEDVPECLAVLKKWTEENDCGPDNCMWDQEVCATEIAFDIFDQLEMKGGVLRVDNKVVAFTFGHALNEKVFDVQIEKALTEYHGVYAMINQQFVEHEMQDFLYVNREEDVNDPGLRKAKLSYYPAILLKKYIATLK